MPAPGIMPGFMNPAAGAALNADVKDRVTDESRLNDWEAQIKLVVVVVDPAKGK